MCTYMYIYNIHFAIFLKLTQHTPIKKLLRRQKMSWWHKEQYHVGKDGYWWLLRKNSQDQILNKKKFSECFNQVYFMYVCMHAQLCLTFCDPMVCSPPHSSVHRIFMARIMERVAMPSSTGSSQQGRWNLHRLRLPHWSVGSLPLALPVYFLFIYAWVTYHSLSKITLSMTIKNSNMKSTFTWKYFFFFHSIMVHYNGRT